MNRFVFAIVHFIFSSFIEYQYKDGCDKSFYMTKCMYDYSPVDFMYP